MINDLFLPDGHTVGNNISFKLVDIVQMSSSSRGVGKFTISSRDSGAIVDTITQDNILYSKPA